MPAPEIVFSYRPEPREERRKRLAKLDTSNNSRCWADWTISAMFG